MKRNKRTCHYCDKRPTHLFVADSGHKRKLCDEHAQGSRSKRWAGSLKPIGQKSG